MKDCWTPEDRNRASFQNVVYHFIAICVFWFCLSVCVCVCLFVQVCCSVVCILVFWGFLVLCL